MILKVTLKEQVAEWIYMARVSVYWQEHGNKPLALHQRQNIP
jgi:hypothetical protein